MDRILGCFSTHHEQRQDLGHFFFFFFFFFFFLQKMSRGRIWGTFLHMMSRGKIGGTFLHQMSKGRIWGTFLHIMSRGRIGSIFHHNTNRGRSRGGIFSFFFFSFLSKVIFSRCHKTCKVSSHPARSPLISRCTMTFLCRKARPSKICRVYLRPTVSVSGPYCFS